MSRKSIIVLIYHFHKRFNNILWFSGLKFDSTETRSAVQLVKNY
jgi:hypothetical protein